MGGEAAARLPVRVAVRCRPQHEADGEPCISIPEGSSTVTVHSGEEEATFTFDACFGSDVAQHDVYSDLVAGPMAALFDGFNCTILAYGQTGSGKTYSMMGSTDEGASPAERARAAGIIPRFGAELFERAASFPGAKVTASYVQLHNEVFLDLLDPASKAELRLRRSEAKGVHIQGLVEKKVASAKELLHLLAKADQGRITASTKLNASSSRSHAILTLGLTLPARTRSPGGGGGGGGSKTITSRANLVDLAGSEKFKDAGETPLRQQESISINQSLTTLGLVIGTLAQQQGASSSNAPLPAHVPYRNSKLTHLLKESLGGSAMCVMLCAVSPSAASLHETLSTLHFASRARSVVNTASRNVAHSDKEREKRERTPPRPRSPRGGPAGGGPRSPRTADAAERRGGGGGAHRHDLSRSLSPPPRTAARRGARPPRASLGGAATGGGGGGTRESGSGTGQPVRSITAPSGRALEAELGMDDLLRAAGMGGGEQHGLGTMGLEPPAWDAGAMAREAAELGLRAAGAGLQAPPPIELPRSPPLHGTALHSTTLHGTAPYGTAPHGAALQPDYWPTLPPDAHSGLRVAPASASASHGRTHGVAGGVGGGVGSATCSGGFSLHTSSTAERAGSPPLAYDADASDHSSEGLLALGANSAPGGVNLSKLFEGVGDEASGTSYEMQVMQLRERLQQVARAAERSEQARAHQSRVYKAELKKAQDKEREKGGEADRLRWELDQLGEREASRQKVSMLQDEVRNFKSASQHKLQSMEMTQLREREATLSRKIREAEDEIKALRGGGEKRLADVEAARSREVEIHERRIVKLMSVIEALTTAGGDERTDMRVLAEKMNQLREVRELLSEEKAMVRSFQKRQREVQASDMAAEREAFRRRISELEAEVKLGRSMGQAQVDEVSQAHTAELNALQRRTTELEEEKSALKRSFEQRLADEKAQRYSDVQERERRRLTLEEGFKAQVAEAKREAAEAQAAAVAASNRAAALMQQGQVQQRELLVLKQQVEQAHMRTHART